MTYAIINQLMVELAIVQYHESIMIITILKGINSQEYLNNGMHIARGIDNLGKFLSTGRNTQIRTAKNEILVQMRRFIVRKLVEHEL